MSDRSRAEKRPETKPRRTPTLVFFYSPRSGPSRRMDSLISWMYVRERKRLALRLVNTEVRTDLAERFDIETVPTVVLLKDRRVVARVEGRATLQQLDEAILPHLAA